MARLRLFYLLYWLLWKSRSIIMFQINHRQDADKLAKGEVKKELTKKPELKCEKGNAYGSNGSTIKKMKTKHEAILTLSRPFEIYFVDF
jgi:hypothetical protein